MAIYELRTYQVVVGKMADVTALYKAEGWPALDKHPKKLVSYFGSFYEPGNWTYRERT